jgi:hypothetical protein
MELLKAMEAGRGMLQDKLPLRYAAVTLLTTQGDPEALARAVESRAAELDAGFGWTSMVTSPIRLLLAAQLVKSGDDTAAFLTHAERLRSLFRAYGMRRDGAHEIQAALVFWRSNGGEEVREAQVVRFKAIYDEMKRHHWWLTGPDDFAACAMLVGRPGAPEEIAAGIERIYVALNEQAGLWKGDPLQTAANVLYLLPLEAHEIADRFVQLSVGLREANIRVGSQEYDEVASLCFLAQPVPRIVESVALYTSRLQEQLSWVGRRMAFSLGASLAFVRLLSGDRDLATLGEVKLLLDMQAIVAAGQAAMVASVS